ncbi:MAG: alpha/beta hydrolase [Actinomycetota bacterium]
MTGQIRPGCEPFEFEGGPAGLLLLHGFTGNPAALRTMGEWLAARGHAVSCPLLAGHGRDWRDLAEPRRGQWAEETDAALRALASRCQGVVVLSLSFGAVPGLHLAATRPDLVRGMAVVNPYLRDRRIAVAPYLWWAIPPRRGIGNDIKKPGQDELPADRIPVRGLAEVRKFQDRVADEIGAVRQPLLVFRSSEDHVAPRGNVEWLLDHVGSEQKEVVDLLNSYHVATLDHDAEVIFERTHEFAEAVVAAHGAR